MSHLFQFFLKNARLSIRYPLWVCCVEQEAEAALQDIWWKSSQDAGVKCFVMNMYSFPVKRHEALHLEDTMLWSAPLLLITRCSCVLLLCSIQRMTIGKWCVSKQKRNSDLFFFIVILLIVVIAKRKKQKKNPLPWLLWEGRGRVGGESHLAIMLCVEPWGTLEENRLAH